MNAKLLSLLALLSFAFAQDPSTTPGAGVPGDTTTPSATIPGGAASPSVSGTASGPLANLPPCIAQCAQQAATAAGCDPSQVSCICDPTFLQSATTCGSACSASDQQAGIAVITQACPGVSGLGGGSGLPSVTGSATTEISGAFPTGSATGGITPPLGNSNAPTGTVTGTGASATTSNAAPPAAAVQGLWALGAGVLGLAVAL